MTEPVESSIAERLDHLFRTYTKPSGAEYSHREVEKEIKNRFGEQLSHAYIGQLRTGRQNNPTIKPLRLLARFFGVPVEYFTRDELAREVDAELGLATAMRDMRDNQDVHRLIIRTRGLSAKSLRSVADIVERIREIEGLPPARDDESA